MIIKLHLLSLLFILLSSEKVLSQNPNASDPADRSMTTGAEFNETPASFLIFEYKGAKENKVIKHSIKRKKSPKEITDWVEHYKNLEALTNKRSPDLVSLNFHSNVPGAVFITENLYCDETEIANIQWQEYLHYIKKDSTALAHQRMFPDSKIISLAPKDVFTMDITGWLPEYPADEKREFKLDTYFEHPAYRFFPVVGISYQQAKAYCQWRTKFVTNLMHQQFPQTRQVSYNFRLPTEKEWELIASAGINNKKYPYGIYPSNVVEIKFKVNSKAAKYIATKINNPPSVAQIKADIKAFNKTNILKNEEVAFNTKRSQPYFLNFNTPFYVYAYPPNDFGIYNLIGNVAEMVDEEGVAKGGSWLEPLSNSKITDRKLYDKPASDIGFRCVCEVEKVK